MSIFNSKSNDFSRGADTTFHSIRMLLRSFIALILLAVILACCITLWITWSRTVQVDRDVAWNTLHAHMLSGIPLPKEAEITWDYDGGHYRVPVSEWLTNAWVQQHTQNVSNALVDGWKIGSTIGGIALFLAIILFIFHGRRLRTETPIRGSQIVSAKSLARRLRWKRRASEISVGEVPLVKDSETQHILVPGTTGAGKTQLLNSALERVRARGEAAIIYDSTGEFVRTFFREGDIILNPMDARSPCWTPWAEIRHPADAVRVASSIVPPARGNADPFWQTAAQRLLAGTLLSMIKKPDRNVAQLLGLLCEPSTKALEAAIKGQPIAAIMASSKDTENRLALSVRGALLPYVEAFQFLPLASSPETEFSLRDWVMKIDHTPGRKPWLFVVSRADHHESLKPLISAWIDCLAAGLMTLAPDRNRRLWFVVDELPSLQRLPSIPRLLAEGRKYGACCVLAMQGIPQLRSVYGHDEAEAIAGLCNTHVVFRTNDPDTAQWTSKSLGERETLEANEAMTYSASSVRDGIHLSQQRQTRPIVLPTEVMQLEALDCYVKLAGNYPITKTRIVPNTKPAVVEPFIEADISKSAWGSFWPTEAHDDPIDELLTPVAFDDNTHSPEEQSNET